MWEKWLGGRRLVVRYSVEFQVPVDYPCGKGLQAARRAAAELRSCRRTGPETWDPCAALAN